MKTKNKVILVLTIFLLTALIVLAGGAMVACDMGDGTEKPGDDLGKDDPGKDDPGKDDPNKISGKNITLPATISEIVPAMPAGGNQGHMDTAMNGTTSAIIQQINNMNANIDRFILVENANEEAGNSTVDFPARDYMNRIKSFHVEPLMYGVNGFDAMLGKIMDAHVAAENRELFTAYMTALRGMSYAGTRLNDKEDYTSTFNFGTGATTVADLLQNINDLTGSDDYTMEGEHPRASVRNGAISLLNDDAHARLNAGVITQMGNFSQYIGLIHRIQQEHNMEATISSTMLSQLSNAVNGMDMQTLRNGILKPQAENTLQMAVSICRLLGTFVFVQS